MESSIALIFRAKIERVVSLLAAAEKPAVSPHPPMATITLTPGGNWERTLGMLVKRFHSVGGGTELKRVDGRKARVTWVISDS